MDTPDSLEKQTPMPASTPVSSRSAAQSTLTLVGRLEPKITFMNQQVVCSGTVATVILILFCMISGMLGVTCFLATYAWAGFQSANTAQVGIALAETFSPGPSEDWRPNEFHMTDRQAVCSLIAFVVGTQIPRLLPLVGIKARTRGFFMLNTFVQVIMTAAAALTIWRSGEDSFALSRNDPSWTSWLGFATVALLAASLGAQGVLGEHATTPFTSTVVATSLFCQLGMLPRSVMLHWGPSKPRDTKFAAIFAIMFGAFIGRAITGATCSAVTIVVTAGIKLVATLLWLFCPDKPWDPKECT